MASKRATMTLKPVPKGGEPGKAPTSAPSGTMATCSVHMELDMLTTLRLVATRRAATAGAGRPSVSDVVREILDRHRAELEAEAAGKGG